MGQDLIVISSGEFVRDVVKIVNELKTNSMIKIVVFCMNIKYHEELKELHPNLVIDVLNRFEDLTKAVNTGAIQIID